MEHERTIICVYWMGSAKLHRAFIAIHLKRNHTSVLVYYYCREGIVAIWKGANTDYLSRENVITSCSRNSSLDCYVNVAFEVSKGHS